MSKSIEGGCLCGAVRYRISGDAKITSICHCRTCRRASSAPSVAWVVFRAGDFAVTTGTPVRFKSSENVVRTFCGNCGSPLTYQNESRTGVIDVTTISLDHPEDFPPSMEIWLEHHVPWEPVNEELPQYSGSSVGEVADNA